MIARQIRYFLPIFLAILISSISSSAQMSARIAPADDGGHYAFGSDWPVVTLNPFAGIQVAVTRQTTDGKSHDGFIPSQRLTVAKAIEGYTLDTAYAGRREETEGSLETGKLADVIIVDHNLLEIDPQNIHETKVVFTIVGGKIVYEAETK